MCGAPGPCGGLSLSRAKPHGFPTFHHSPSLVGSRASSGSMAWEGSETSEVVGFGEEDRISSLSRLSPPPQPPPPPHSSLRVFASYLRSVSAHTQGGLCSAYMVTAVTGPPPGTRPLHNWPLKPQRPGSPDTKRDPVMSYPRACACVCIIRAKGRSYVTAQCKLTVPVCEKV